MYCILDCLITCDKFDFYSSNIFCVEVVIQGREIRAWVPDLFRRHYCCCRHLNCFNNITDYSRGFVNGVIIIISLSFVIWLFSSLFCWWPITHVLSGVLYLTLYRFVVSAVPDSTGAYCRKLFGVTKKLWIIPIPMCYVFCDYIRNNFILKNFIVY